MDQSRNIRRRAIGFVIALVGVAVVGAATHATTAQASALPTQAICDSYGTCYDDGLTTYFNDPTSPWLSYSDPYAGTDGTSGWFNVDTGQDWNLWGGDISGSGGASSSSSFNSYDYGSPFGGAGDSSLISNYSDPGL